MANPGPPRPADLIFPFRREAIIADVCVDCGNPAETFTDRTSTAEYLISGMCQNCQDALFKC